MFQPALTTHDIDAHSAIWTCSSFISPYSIISPEQVGVCVYMNNAAIMTEKCLHCAKADNSISVAVNFLHDFCIDKIMRTCEHFSC